MLRIVSVDHAKMSDDDNDVLLMIKAIDKIII